MCLSIKLYLDKMYTRSTYPNNLQVNHVIQNGPCLHVVSGLARVVEIHLKVMLLYEFTLRLFFFILNSNSFNPFLAIAPILYPL